MQRQIRPARPDDLAGIVCLVHAAVLWMHAHGNDQWSEQYPTEADFAKDIAENTLYLLEEQGQAIGIVCLNRSSPAEYAPQPWAEPENALILHRMAVSPDAHRRGVGKALLRFAEQRAAAEGLGWIHTDTYSKNHAMNPLLAQSGYRKVGSMHFRGKESLFYCYEKAAAAQQAP